MIKSDLLTQSFIGFMLLFIGTSWDSVGVFNQAQSITISERIVQLKKLFINNLLKFATFKFFKKDHVIYKHLLDYKTCLSLFFCYQIQIMETE